MFRLFSSHSNIDSSSIVSAPAMMRIMQIACSICEHWVNILSDTMSTLAYVITAIATYRRQEKERKRTDEDIVAGIEYRHRYAYV
jgi:hypothetical protein